MRYNLRIRKRWVLLILLTLVLLAGIPESFASPQYLASFNAVYGEGSCGTCHVRPSGGGPRNSYGTLFESQPDHATDPSAALKAIGSPSTATLTLTPTATLTPEAIPIATETPAETTSSGVTTVTASGTPTAAGFGFVLSLLGLFACALLARRHNK